MAKKSQELRCQGQQHQDDQDADCDVIGNVMAHPHDYPVTILTPPSVRLFPTFARRRGIGALKWVRPDLNQRIWNYRNKPTPQLFKCDGKQHIPAGTGAMVASQFEWTTALMVLGLLVAMVCVFLYARSGRR